MRLPVLTGLIRRRLLVNYRISADVIERMLPGPLRPQLHHGFAIAGICLIRLEQIRPSGLPAICGLASENAAHRIAVQWDDQNGQLCQGVYVPRRDTNSRLNCLAGGRIFPGQQHLANFVTRQDQGRMSVAVQSRDHQVRIHVSGRASANWARDSCFESLAQSSEFFAGGKIGYSATADCCRLDGMELQIEDWQVEPFAVDCVQSSYFDDRSRFPVGAVQFDHALYMHDVPHQWQRVADLMTEASANGAGAETAAFYAARSRAPDS